ncbi:MAG: YciI family protein [Planctomycetota bacterium]
MREWLVVLTATEAVLADEPSPEAIRAVGEHYQRLVRLRDEGTVILAGRTMDAEPMGLVIYRARTAEEARALSNADPAVAGGFMIAEVRPYAVAVWGEHAITPPRG